jgi:hypothetical protein
VAAAGKKQKQAVVDKMLTPWPTKSAESSVKTFFKYRIRIELQGASAQFSLHRKNPEIWTTLSALPFSLSLHWGLQVSGEEG